MNRGGATTWDFGCGCRDTDADVGAGFITAGLGTSSDAETVGIEGFCTVKWFAFMLLKASLASLFALTLQRPSVSSSGGRESHFTCQSIFHLSSGLLASRDLMLVQQS